MENNRESTPLLKTEKQANSTPSDWHVYLLRCADNSLYCGMTTNLAKRLRQHNGELSGGAKYTQARQPCTLVYSEAANSRKEAAQQEYAIKQLTKAAKEYLISHY